MTLVGITPDSRAERYPFNTISVEDGLPQSQVIAIHQDRLGYLWFGTDGGGTCRYDGATLRCFGSKEGLRDVYQIAEDQRGRLWFASYGDGAVVYDGSTFRKFKEADGLIDDRVAAVLVDSSNVVWLGTEDGVSRYDGESFMTFADAAAFGGELVLDILEDSDGSFWFATEGAGVRKWNRRGFTSFTTRDGLPDDTVWFMVEASNGDLWFATDAGVARYDGKQFHLELADVPAWALLEDTQGRVWMGTAEGLATTSGIEPRNLTTRLGLCHDSVSALYEDREGGLWAGTDGGGACRYGGASFTTFDVEDGLTAASVLAMVEDQRGTIWFGTEKGLSRSDSSSDSFIDAEILRDKTVWAISQSDDGRMWFAVDMNQIFVFDGERFAHLDIDHDLGNEMVLGIRASAKGELWLATFGSGLLHYDGRTLVNFKRNGSVPHDTLGTLFEDSHSRLWITTDGGGVDLFDGAGFRHFGSLEGFIDESVLAMAEDHAGHLWFATSGSGLIQATFSDGRRLEVGQRLTQQDGLTDDEILSLAVDETGSLWAGTNRGVSRVTVSAEGGSSTIEAFGKSEGILGIECNQESILTDSEGNIWFGTIAGATRYDPRIALPRPEEIPTHITAVRLFLQDTDWSAWSTGTDARTGLPMQLRLPYSENHITFDFVGINLGAPDRVRYRYQLAGFDADWTPISPTSQATYSNLSPGRYTFLVKASGADSRWDGQATSYSFEIRAPYWQLWWFRLPAALLLVAIPFALMRVRLRILERHRLEDLVNRRTFELQLETEKVAAINVELGSEKERLAVTLRSIGEGVVSTDIEGRIVLLSKVAERLTGWTESDAIGLNVADILLFFDTKNRTIRVDPGSFTAPSESSTPRNVVLIDRQGGEHDISYRTAPIHSSARDVVGVVVVFRDIADERRVERELQRAQQLESVGLLAGGIAHDFNNFLMGILGSITMLRSEGLAKQQISDLLAQAERTTLGASALTRQLLTFAQGGQPVTRVLCMDPLIHDVVDFALHGSNVRATLRVAEDLWPVEIDETQIRQAIHNLVINADQAMADGGTILVTAGNFIASSDDAPLTVGDRYVRLSITDEGIGIPVERQEKIFDPYFTTKPHGSGLGLTTAYSIVHRHRGLLRVDSEAKRGATFHLSLPASSQPLPTQTASVPEQSAQILEAKVLSLEDNEINQQLVIAMLEREGMEVTAAMDGREAVRAFGEALHRSEPFDLVLADLTIPGGMGGCEALLEMKALDSAVKAVVVSGYSNDPVMANFREYGFVAALAKPFKAETLVNLVKQILTGESVPGFDDSPVTPLQS